MTKNKYQTLIEHLSQLGNTDIRYIKAEYAGSGDSGGIDSIEFLREDKRPSLMQLSDEFENIAEQVFYECLEDAFGGYEDGDGGHGQMTLDLEDLKLEITNFYAVTEYEESTPVKLSLEDYAQKAK
jgi:hypothetical protein